MSMWSRLKVAALTATVAVTALSFGGCLNLGGAFSYEKLLQYVVIGNLFD